MVPFAARLRLYFLVWESLRLDLAQCDHSGRRCGCWRTFGCRSLPRESRHPRCHTALWPPSSSAFFATTLGACDSERIRKVEHDYWAGIPSTIVETTCTLSGRIDTRKKPRKTEILRSRLNTRRRPVVTSTASMLLSPFVRDKACWPGPSMAVPAYKRCTFLHFVLRLLSP